MVEVDSVLGGANVETVVEIEILSGDGWDDVMIETDSVEGATTIGSGTDVDGNESDMIIINNNIYFMLPIRTTNKNCDLF